MTSHLLQLADRRENIPFLTAGAAYRWLDGHAQPGEHYRLAYTNGHPSSLHLIDASTYRLPDSDPAP